MNTPTDVGGSVGAVESHLRSRPRPAAPSTESLASSTCQSPRRSSQAPLSVIRALVALAPIDKSGRAVVDSSLLYRYVASPALIRPDKERPCRHADRLTRILVVVTWMRSDAGGGMGAERDRRGREGHDRRRDAGRHGRGRQPRADRENPVGRHRRTRPVQDRRPPARRVRGHLHPARVQHRQARGVELPDQLHRDDQRRPAGRRARRNGHRLRPVAGGRRAERGAADGAHAAGARRGADRPQHSDARRAAAPARASRCPTSAAHPACRTATSRCTDPTAATPRSRSTA